MPATPKVLKPARSTGAMTPAKGGTTPAKKTVMFGGSSTKTIPRTKRNSPIPSDDDEDDDDDEEDDDSDAASDDDDDDDEEEDEEDEEEEEDDDEDELDDEDDEAVRAAFADEHLSVLQDQLSALERQEDAALFSAKQALSDDARKSLHVSNQQKLWRDALSVRMQLQTPLTLAQRLPTPAQFAAARGLTSAAHAAAVPESESLHKRACIAAAVTAQALDDLLALQEGLAAASAAAAGLPAPGEAGPWPRPGLLEGLTAKARVKYEQRWRDSRDARAGTGSKRARAAPEDSASAVDADLATIEAHLSAQWAGAQAARDAVLDKWHKRVSVATGRADLGTDGGKGVKNKGKHASAGAATGAVDSAAAALSAQQKLSAQVAHIVDVDEDRLVQRTRMRRSSARSLGAPALAPRAPGEDEDAFLARERLARFDDEVFDDSDFFGTLLRELTQLAADSTATGAGAGSLAASIAAQQTALKRTMDAVGVRKDRSRKDKRLKFAPIPKLANFMVPIVSPAWVAACASMSGAGAAVGDAAELVVDELLQGLFGQAQRQQPAVETAETAAQARARAAVAALPDPSDDDDSDDDEEEDGEGDSGDDDGDYDEDDEEADAAVAALVSKAGVKKAAASPAKKGGKKAPTDAFAATYGDADEELYGDFEVMDT